MNLNNYLVEGIASNRQKNKEMIAQQKNLKREYLIYKQNGGRLPITDFKDPKKLQYEKDKKANPKMYPNFQVWEKINLDKREREANIVEKETRNRRRLAQAKHEESIAAKNKAKLR